ncbi:riboflavin biosynthesis protein [Flavobacterium ammoniigenes]|uniref:Riboflavin biosynthesis protein n=1 Tax=Flavobacterium ammoniigenes TaxID=1751095 RepID=A0ABM7V4B3_9FLAO|nr:bifunctional riboflavin kinase/FAD synthetase [Flavobacterium ammoniigenes]BDB54391.1 riboflavin biosynthesis protein [Flavobacterium ammoniigenes]
MNIFHSINEFHSDKKTIVTIGTFDGVHLGHAAILKKLTQNTQNETFESTVLTFFPHPRMVLQGKSDLKLLNTINEKIELLEKIGIDNLIIHPFDEKFAELNAEAFVSTILVDHLRVQKIIIGYDHRFGKNRTANIDDLISFGAQYGFEVEQISAQEIDEISISSTKIRTALEEGDIQLANEYLGYSYFLSGTVVKGKQLGRTIGFPTANISLEEDYKLVPQNGVYVVQAEIDCKTIYGMMNIGFNPTVQGKQKTIEVHFFDFEADIYNRKIQVAILQRIRSEKKFESIELLTKQLEEDRNFSRNYLQNLENK